MQISRGLWNRLQPVRTLHGVQFSARPVYSNASSRSYKQESFDLWIAGYGHEKQVCSLIPSCRGRGCWFRGRSSLTIRVRSYDMEHPVNMKGVVTNIEWTNPHVFIFLNVKDESGQRRGMARRRQQSQHADPDGLEKGNDQGGRRTAGEWRCRKNGTKVHAAHYTHPSERPKVRWAGIQIIDWDWKIEAGYRAELFQPGAS